MPRIARDFVLAEESIDSLAENLDDLLLAAKNHYWNALKAHGEDDMFAHQLRTNLGNALRKSGRITEALTAYDDVIASDPSFVMAHFHRALSLLVLEHLSGTSWKAVSAQMTDVQG